MRRLILTFLLLLSLAIAQGAAPVGRNGLEDVPMQSPQLSGYTSEDSVRTRLRSIGMHAAEGVWEFAGTGTRVAVERIDTRRNADASTLYRIVALRSSDLTLRPGTVIGFMVTTAQRGVYDARIYTRTTPAGSALMFPEKFIVRLADSGSRLAANPYGRKLHFNWWRLVPSSYRGLFTMEERDPGEIAGCVRVYPEPLPPIHPRYL